MLPILIAGRTAPLLVRRDPREYPLKTRCNGNWRRHNTLARCFADRQRRGSVGTGRHRPDAGIIFTAPAAGLPGPANTDDRLRGGEHHDSP